MKAAIVIFCGWFAIAQGRTLESVYKPRVVNGEDAKLEEIPYQVSIQLKGEGHFCGGSILNEYWVVTAAHCMDGNWRDGLSVVAGTVDLRQPYSRHVIERIIIHDYFSARDSYVNDISLIKVATPFKFSSRIKPAVLPELHAKVKTNSSVVVSGWGYVSDGSLPDILQKATVYITDPQVCQLAVQERGFNIYPTHVCANNPTIIRGECQGDSGGPVTVDGVLTGIVSWSIKDPGCGSTHFPGVHTRVSEYIDWIHEHAK